MAFLASEVADRLDISDTLIRYATALDTRDLGLLDAVFTPDAVLDYDTSHIFYGRASFAEHLGVALEPMAATQHLVVNHVVAIEGEHVTCHLLRTGPARHREDGNAFHPRRHVPRRNDPHLGRLEDRHPATGDQLADGRIASRGSPTRGLMIDHSICPTRPGWSGCGRSQCFPCSTSGEQSPRQTCQVASNNA
jgi:SnoaL-like domain